MDPARIDPAEVRRVLLAGDDDEGGDDDAGGADDGDASDDSGLELFDLTDPDQFDEAMDYFRSLLPVSEAEWDAMTVEARKAAFKVAGVAQADLIVDVMDAIDDAIANGTTFDDFKDAVGDKLQAAWAGSVENPPWRLETIFRTNCSNAYQAGRYAQMTHPAVAKHRPYWRMLGIEDSRESEYCALVSGVVVAADDPWWQGSYPPRHFNCRTTVQTLSEDEAQAIGITPNPPDVPAMEGFGLAPTVGGWEPDLGDYPTEIADALGDRLDEADDDAEAAEG